MKAIYTKVEEPADIRCYVPYTKPTATLQTVVDCIRIGHVQPDLVKVDAGDAYWTLLRDAWEAGREFFIVEQDVIVWQGALRHLAECPEEWCSLPTVCHGRLMPTTFGCVKFGQRLIDRNPRVWDDLARSWFLLDANFADKMGWPYIRPHPHMPPATHLNEVQWPDELSKRWSLERKVIWQSMDKAEPVMKVNYRIAGDRRRSRERVATATNER